MREQDSAWLAEIRRELLECLEDLAAAADLGKGRLLVVGASTSEVCGHRIGSHTSVAVGRALVETLMDFADGNGCDLAFQCCEHLNRALVVRRGVAAARGYTEVSAVPVPGAGGSVAAWAYFTWPDACLVERVEADAGVDIGDTLIGMHLRRVAVPVRGRRNRIGEAHVVMARTRPPLVGGSRAVYDPLEARRRLFDGGRMSMGEEDMG
ncbi:TIGR01440 family protein [Alicyclobacillus sp.]|uniref:TIGR01440 family protein n=1 Tax=Alicyclobacillus sp. TaxID=61169 RepID=UPI0025C02E9F|nr:TIGR01440 family protein [Alicyclobacillus sp.]MCL6515837.1 TIGR01440 family protein [Alicyclobacillus sp.]